MNTRPAPVTLLAAVVLLTSAVHARAQIPTPPPDPDTQPIPRVVVDARGVFPRFKQNAAIADGIGVSTANLPTHGLGLVIGAHVYPFRIGRMTVGFGGELLRTRASRTLDPADDASAPGPTVTTRVSALSPQISFNFGKQNGWSYISGGIGGSTFVTERDDAPLPDETSGSKTINYGGGARWFAKRHVALSVDLRFYAINPRDAGDGLPARPRMTLLMLSAGASFK